MISGKDPCFLCVTWDSLSINSRLCLICFLTLKLPVRRLEKPLCAPCAFLQDETVTIETVFPFDVAVRFVSTKVCSVMGARNHDSLSDSKKQISIIAD